jgi:hypothetical protein
MNNIIKYTESIRNNEPSELDYGTIRILSLIDRESQALYDEISILYNRITEVETVLLMVYNDWSNSNNIIDPEADGYDTLQKVKQIVDTSSNSNEGEN